MSPIVELNYENLGSVTKMLRDLIWPGTFLWQVQPNKKAQRQKLSNRCLRWAPLLPLERAVLFNA